MTGPLLAIKTNIPRTREKLVSRPRLLDRIDQGMTGHLVLISAPAGFGKTTLVTSWIETTGRLVVWLSLDENENEFSLFLRYLLAAFQKLDISLGNGIEAAPESQMHLQGEVLLTYLINEISAHDQSITLVLDDYHLVDNADVHHALDFLIQHMPSNLNVVLVSRVDPPIHISRLRASGMITEIRSNDLRFTSEEVNTFLNDLMNLSLSENEMTTLRLRTEGWITGLQLAALSLRDRKDKQRFIEQFSGSHQYIIDYLMEEVLDGLEEEVRVFLYQISILDRFCAPLCDAILESHNSHQIISELEKSNLFLVSLDDERRWFRFHQLFVDFLRHAVNFDVEMLKEKHRRASEWFEAQGEYIQAINHRVEAEDYIEAARIIDVIGIKLLEQSELARLMRLIAALPHDQACVHPWVCIYHAWALRLTGGAYEEVERLLFCAEEAAGLVRELDRDGLVRLDAESRENEYRMRAHQAAIRAYQALYREDIPSAIQLSRQALDHQPEGNFIRSSIALAQGLAYRFGGDLEAASRALEEARSVGLSSDNIYLAATATCRLAYTLLLQGKLQKAEDLCQEALRIATLKGGRQLPVAGYVQIYLGYIHYLRNKLVEARRELMEGIERCRQVGYVVDQIVGTSLLARVYQAEGDHEAAQDSLVHADQLSGRMKGYLYAKRWVEDTQVRFWGISNDTDKLSSWIQACGMTTKDIPSFLREVDQLILARAILYQQLKDPEPERLGEVNSYLAQIRVAVHQSGWVSKEIETVLLQCIGYTLSGVEDRALELLDSAVDLAEPGGFIRPFIEEGEHVHDLLHIATGNGVKKGFYRRIIASIDGAIQSDREAAVRSTKSELVEPLSRREFEVLGLLAGDLNGPEIAGHLCIAVSTLRYHTNQIYTKLGVHSRREAVSRARDLQIL